MIVWIMKLFFLSYGNIILWIKIFLARNFHTWRVVWHLIMISVPSYTAGKIHLTRGIPKSLISCPTLRVANTYAISRVSILLESEHPPIWDLTGSIAAEFCRRDSGLIHESMTTRYKESVILTIYRFYLI